MKVRVQLKGNWSGLGGGSDVKTVECDKIEADIDVLRFLSDEDGLVALYPMDEVRGVQRLPDEEGFDD